MSSVIFDEQPSSVWRHRYLLALSAVLAALAVLAASMAFPMDRAEGQTASGLVHPGGWHSQEDLTVIRDNVAAGKEPWITGWNAAKDEGPDAGTTSNPSRLITSNGAMHGAGFDAWVLTMKWVASGDSSYSDAAIAIIDAWVDTVRDFDVYGPTLTVSTGAGAMAQAAEILEHGFNGEAGWPQSDADAAKVWFKEVIYDPWTNTGLQSSSNWGTSALGGNMSMAIFMNDEAEYNYQLEAFKSGYPNTDDGCNSLEDYIMYPSGQAFETGRDQPHVQGGIAHLTETALVMWNQGDQLVFHANNRLLAGVEYHARYNLGYNDLPFNTTIPNRCNVNNREQDKGISDVGRGELSPVYWMSAKLFSKAGLAYPNTEEVLSSPGYSPEINNFAHPGLGTFAFVPTSSEPLPPGAEVVHMTKGNATGFAIDGNNGAANLQGIYLFDEDDSNVNQQWIEIDRGGGHYSYQKSGTNHCIDGNNGGANGQEVYLFTCADNNHNQHWLKVATSGGTYRLQKRNSPSYSIDGNRGGVNFQTIYLWNSDSNNENQQWFISPR